MEKLLEMKEICKSFGTNNVLKNVQFDLFAGEVHALIGENGAGKSTLMKILMGMYKKDSGSLSVLGSDEAYTNPDQALKAGVAMIHQELNPIPDMSVAENIFLGKEKRKWIFTSKKEQEKESKRYLDMLGIDLEPSVLMRELSVSEMQMVEIAKALSYGARIIIMDEPTSAITEAEVEKLFQNIKMLKEQGTGIIYISHKMDELFEMLYEKKELSEFSGKANADKGNTTYHPFNTAHIMREIDDFYDKKKGRKKGRTASKIFIAGLIAVLLVVVISVFQNKSEINKRPVVAAPQTTMPATSVPTPTVTPFTVTIENYVGLEKKAAVENLKKLKDEGLTVRFQTKYSKKAKGTVIEQNIPAGETYSDVSKKTLRLTISKGKKKIVATPKPTATPKPVPKKSKVKFNGDLDSLS